MKCWAAWDLKRASALWPNGDLKLQGNDIPVTTRMETNLPGRLCGRRRGRLSRQSQAHRLRIRRSRHRRQQCRRLSQSRRQRLSRAIPATNPNKEVLRPCPGRNRPSQILSFAMCRRAPGSWSPFPAGRIPWLSPIFCVDQPYPLVIGHVDHQLRKRLCGGCAVCSSAWPTEMGRPLPRDERVDVSDSCPDASSGHRRSGAGPALSGACADGPPEPVRGHRHGAYRR